MFGATAVAVTAPSRFQLYAAAIVIAMATMIVVDGSTAQHQHQRQRSHRRRLPQHQVHAPKREVPYPAWHPLGRHKRNQQQQQQIILDAWEYDTISNPADRNTNIIAGDGSRAQQQQRQYEQQQFRTKQQPQQWEKHQHGSQTEMHQHRHRFLRYLGNPRIWGIDNDNSSKSRRGRNDKVPNTITTTATNTAAEIPESMQEGQLVVESKDDTTNNIMLRYWTISGRNLVTTTSSTTTTSTSREAMHEQMNNKDEDENDSVASLLMDVHRIYDENEEASSSSSGGSSIGEEGDGTLSAEGQVIEGIESSIVNGEGWTADADNTAVDSITEDGNDPQYVADEGDDIDTIHSSSSSTSSTTATTTTSPTTSLYQPIRLRAILTDDESSGSKYLTPSQRQILMEEIINPALFAWSQALHVVPVGSGGGADGGVTKTNHQNLVVDQCSFTIVFPVDQDWTLVYPR